MEDRGISVPENVDCYSRYIGTGKHLFVLLKGYDKAIISDINEQISKIQRMEAAPKSLRSMVEAVSQECKIIAADVEMCSMWEIQ